METCVRDQILAIENPVERLVVSIDVDTWKDAHTLIRYLPHELRYAKVNSLADLTGTLDTRRQLGGYNLRTMLDYKLHDINETMRRRARNISLSGCAIITLHALSGAAGMQAARQGVDEAMSTLHSPRPLLSAVTVLTSHNETATESLFGAGRMRKVRELTHMAMDSGVESIVCAADESEMIKTDSFTEKLITIVPAVRPDFAITRDEQAEQAATPRQAMSAGAGLLIVGRPIVAAQTYGLSPAEATAQIIEEIS